MIKHLKHTNKVFKHLNPYNHTVTGQTVIEVSLKLINLQQCDIQSVQPVKYPPLTL